MQDELLYRYLVGKCTTEEEAQIRAWYAADPEAHQQEIDRVRFLFESTLIHEVIGREGSGRRLSVPRRLFGRMLRTAAVIALLIGAAYGSHVLTRRDLTGQMTSIRVPAGQRICVDLADGTQVWLNSESELTYPTVFAGRRREVRVSGEALFSVKSDPSRPFLVETYASRLEVLGTKFNVVADEAANRFSTMLLEGRLRVTDLASSQQVVLRPDDLVERIDGRLVVRRNDDPAAAQWIDGIISMKGVSFEELMARFEKIYNVRIEIECDRMPTIEFESGKIRVSDGVDHALRVLQHVADFDFEHDQENNVIRIR